MKYHFNMECIKVCPDPQCEAIFHNCPKNLTKCKDCGGWIIAINEDTYWKKFAKSFFQYDYASHKYYYPKPKVEQLKLFS